LPYDWYKYVNLRDNTPQAPAPAYQVGDIGPAGGIIFYVKEDNSDGWRYMEAAPQSTEWEGIEWGPMDYDVRYGDVNDVGAGIRAGALYIPAATL